MKNIIIASAGHVDHGKSALIKALTGVDTDRLKEEKKRGISIDLGFALLTLEEKVRAGIIDVPGHERFLKNMLAGTGAIDLAMLVIAADESVMPQTKEHLDMLELLGVKHGIIAVNKIDKIDKTDSDWLDFIEDEIAQAVKNTFLKDAPLCRVSAVSGEGLAELKSVILKMAEKIPARDETAPFRLWIDRVFSVKGYGVVVTGSVLSGKVSIGDNLMVYPQGRAVRVRGLHSHEQKAETLKAGQRAAVNISGIETAELARGMCLSSPKRGETSRIWDVKINRHQDSQIKSALRIRLHIGTEEVLGRIYKYKNTTLDYMRLILEKPLCAAVGDRGILRLYSPQNLLGAATFLSAGRLSRKFPSGCRLIDQGLLSGEDALPAIITGRLAGERKLKTLKDIAGLCGYYSDEDVEKAVKKLAQSGVLIQTESGNILKSELKIIAQETADILRDFYAENKQAEGMGKEVLRQRLALEEKTFEDLLIYWQKEGGKDLVITGGGSQIAQKDYALRHDVLRQDLAQRSQAFLNEAGINNIDSALVGVKLGLSPQEAKTAHEMLIKAGELVKIGTMYLPAAAVTRIILLTKRHFEQSQDMSVAEFKDLAGASRKTAVPLLEYLDAQKYTVRSKDVRRPTAKLLNFAKVLSEEADASR